MSQPRRLWVRCRKVDPRHREVYREAVVAAGVTAGRRGAHCWVFEVDGGEGRFIEFFEGPSDEAVAAFLEEAEGSLRGAAGSEASDTRVGAAGLRCTEFG
jgi:hypothetical protein